MKKIIEQPEPTDEVIKFRIKQTAVNCFFPAIPYTETRSGVEYYRFTLFGRVRVKSPAVVTERWWFFPDVDKPHTGGLQPKKSFASYDEAVEFVLQYYRDRSTYPITFEETRKIINLNK